MTVRILGISGRIGAGKDTLAAGIGASLALFSPAKFLRVGLADPIKETLILSFDVRRDLAFGSQADKKTEMRPGISIRDGAKILGKAFTTIDPEYYIKYALKVIEVHAWYYPDLLAVIPDVRFPIEAEAIRARNGKTIRLGKVGDPSDTSPSEMALDSARFDYEIQNTELTPKMTLALTLRYLQQEGFIHGPAL